MGGATLKNAMNRGSRGVRDTVRDSRNNASVADQSKRSDRTAVSEMSRLRGMSGPEQKMVETIQSQIDELKSVVEAANLRSMADGLNNAMLRAREDAAQVTELRANHNQSLDDISALTGALQQMRAAIVQAMEQHQQDQSTLHMLSDSEVLLQSELEQTKAQLAAVQQAAAKNAQEMQHQFIEAAESSAAAMTHKLETMAGLIRKSKAEEQRLSTELAVTHQSLAVVHRQVDEFTKLHEAAAEGQSKADETREAQMVTKLEEQCHKLRDEIQSINTKHSGLSLSLEENHTSIKKSIEEEIKKLRERLSAAERDKHHVDSEFAKALNTAKTQQALVMV